MVYIIGIQHEYQHNGLGYNKLLKNKLTSYLENIVKKYAIYLIAEEFSEEALQTSKATISTAKEIADKLGLMHLFCDPNTQERMALGIPSCSDIKKTLGLKDQLNHDEIKILNDESRKYFSIREAFWLDKIKPDINDSTILFLCGSDHVDNFNSLLISNGYKVKILIFEYTNL